MASPWGVAMKMTSDIAASSAGEASMKAMSVRPSKRGYVSDSGWPLNLREVSPATCTSGCLSRIRISSSPV